jgi:dihydroorotate dehydrogenase (NAD+) catalytic subunit
MINLSLLHQKILANQTPIHFASVSGVVTTKPSLIRYADQQLGLELINTKSFQVLPNPGNREPILCEMGVG